ncbi:RNA polymerase sigma factor [Sphingobacterium mizutaii]|uniref:RNA polymerase sigma factor n=1 Tax=Sphingobacterium mizutaii TaxID=1010 RepID=UPI003D96ADB7
MNSTYKSDQFLAVVQANKGIIYKVANSYCKDAEDRKDLVQEIIVQLWKSFDNYNERFAYSTWIYKIALNVSISSFRRESRRKEVNGPITDSILFFEDQSEDGREEEISLLQKFIQELRELERALMLLYLDEKSYKEIAEIVGISETNVATKISRIKKVLKQKFEQYNRG